MWPRCLMDDVGWAMANHLRTQLVLDALNMALWQRRPDNVIHLTTGEIDRLLTAAKQGRHGVRNHLIILMMFRHGLRVSEAVTVKIDDVDLKRSRLWVRRLKNGLSVEQPIPGDGLRAIKRYLKTRASQLPWLFVSERGQPLTRKGQDVIKEILEV